MKEEAVLFGEASSLVGIITDPSPRGIGPDLPAVLLLNAGRIHRVGPNCLYVKIARALAAMGFVVLRFDFSGIGDSKVREETLPMESSAVLETQEAMNHLTASRGLIRFVLVGICSGGSTAFRAACHDSRVVGVLAINARYHLSETYSAFDSNIGSRALALHYWRIALLSSFRIKKWLKFFTGKVNYWKVLKALMNLPVSRLPVHRSKEVSSVGSVVTNLRTLAERGVHLLHLYSEGDQSLDCYHVAMDQISRKENARELLKAEVIRGADHTFILLWSQRELLRIICNWMQEITMGYPAGLHTE